MGVFGFWEFIDFGIIGLLDFWIIGVLGFLDYWIIGFLVYWSIGLLDYWFLVDVSSISSCVVLLNVFILLVYGTEFKCMVLN